MSAAAWVDPQRRPVLSLEQIVALRSELAGPRIAPERREEIRTTLKLAKDRQEVSRSLAHGWDETAFKLCGDVLAEDERREEAARQSARDQARLARLEQHRQHVAGRPARFAALPKMQQALLYAESKATDARSGFRALAEALAQQATGEQVETPWTFEPDLLPYGKVVELHRQGFVDDDFAEQARQRNMRESAVW